MNDELPWQRLPSSVSGITIFLHNQGLAVHSKYSDTLYGFEGVSANIFLRLEQGESVEEIMADCPEEKKNDILTVLNYCERILNSRFLSNAVGYVAAIDYPDSLPLSRVDGKCYKLLGTCFQISSGSDLCLDAIYAELVHIECIEVEFIPEIIFEFVPNEEMITVLSNGKELHHALPFLQLFPFLLDYMRTVAYQRLPYLLTIHSAALYKNDLCVLLPGVSGAGKSTLTSALLKQGYQLLSDEVTVVNLNDLGVYSIPMPITLKQGSWSLLQSLYPELKESSIHCRFDGQAIRYIMPPMVERGEKKRIFATHIIFPRLCDDCAGELKPLTVLAALAKLDTCGYQIQDELGVGKAESILNWLAGLDAYQLSYQHFDQAIEAIEGLS